MAPLQRPRYSGPATAALQRPPPHLSYTSATADADTNVFINRWGGVGQLFLGESQSRLYPHMRAKFGRGSTVVSKKGSLKFNNR